MEDLLLQLLGAVLEIIGEALLEIVFEVATEALLQTVFETAAAALNGLVNRWRERGPAVSAIGLAFAGGATGLLSAVLFPHRLIAARAVVSGVSLLLAPLATGYAMHLLGDRLRRFGRYPSNLATFRGGALCAFSMALIRWWLVGRH